jgi:pilus assembly protein Flp/PilA
MFDLKRFAADENGATAIEYGLIAALVAVAVIASMTSLGTSVSSTWGKVAGNMNS